MARPDSQAATESLDTSFDLTRDFLAGANPPTAIPYEALARLSHLHGEARADLSLNGMLARSPQACVLLMVGGALVLMASDASLKCDFAWAAALLMGVLAMTRNYIRGFARSLRRVPLQEAASDLRTLLLYTGMAWGTGAFVVMPGLPSPAFAIAFAILPCFAIALILRDEKGATAFCIPIMILSAAAALMQAWPADSLVAAFILLAGTAAIFLPAFVAMLCGRRETFPAAY
jgi:hypothetical protein